MTFKCQIFEGENEKKIYELDFLTIPRVGEIITVKTPNKPGETKDLNVTEIIHSFVNGSPAKISLRVECKS